MPDDPPPKMRLHPHRRDHAVAAVPARAAVDFAELCCTTNFTFLTGASHPDEYAGRAAELGYAAFGVTDANSLAGVVRAHVAAKAAGVAFAPGCRLVFADPPGLEVCAWPTSLAAYGRLCRLLTLGKRRAIKGKCSLALRDLADHAAGLMLAALPPPRRDRAFEGQLRALRDMSDIGHISLAACRAYGPDDECDMRDLAHIARDARVPLLATNRPLYHCPTRRLMQDVLTCVRHGCTLEQAGFRLEAHAERHMKEPEEMARIFAEYPGAIGRTAEVAAACTSGFTLDLLRYQYPGEVVPPGRTAMSHLRDLAHKGLANRFPNGAPDKVRQQFAHELELIEELALPHYFLTVEDLVRWSRSRGILCQGRGAAANSIVCYALGVTEADPTRINTLFERFVSRARDEPPDIDVDFEHERREEAIQYLYKKYGRDRAALTANVITYRGRSAVREVGKALGLGLDAVDALAKGIDWWAGGPVTDEQLTALRLDPGDVTIRHLVRLSAEIQGFPRHLGQHPGGFVLTQTPLCEIVPIENAAMPDRTVIEWDKDDIDALGIIKVDVLGLGMLTCLAKAYALLRDRGIESSVSGTPDGDAATFDMICRADTVGVFQIESRAQMSMLPRLRPRCWYDLVVEVAIVRPGPIQGQMVHPYLRRRRGEEAAEYPDAVVERILGKTLGVPLFQEQAMHLAVECAGFTPDEADQLRRAVTGFRHVSGIEEMGGRIVGGMLARGYPRDFAERVFEQIKGFSTYGFPESHAASFALLAYASSYVKCHWPGVFLCAILNSQPMGFYRPAQLVADARRHGVRVLPVDVGASGWDCSLEGGGLATVRLGMNRVKGLGEPDARRVAAAVAGREQPFASIESLWRASGASARAMRCLARADGFGSMGLDRQSALWHAGRLRDEAAPLFDRPGLPEEPEGEVAALPAQSPLRRVLLDYGSAGLSLRGHPMAQLRDGLDSRGVLPAAALADEGRYPPGRRVAVAGVCLVRQRPGTARKITFMTLEDETGFANLVVYPNVFARWRRVARDANAMLVRGRIDRQGEVVHVVAFGFESLDARLSGLASASRNFH